MRESEKVSDSDIERVCEKVRERVSSGYVTRKMGDGRLSQVIVLIA